MTAATVHDIQDAVPPIYLFTWNLHGKQSAHDLAVDHLAQRANKELFIACVQEIPAASLIAQARTKTQPGLKERKIEVLKTEKRCRSLALLHSPELTVLRAEGDADGEFLAAVFQLPASRTQVGVVGLHAKSKIDMRQPAEWGGSRALLRHAIHELRLLCDHTIVLGDFNSKFDDPEMLSWHCFYALSGPSRPMDSQSGITRRGFSHAPLYVVRPSNADAIGTFLVEDSGMSRFVTVDFFVVDERTRVDARSEILTRLSAKEVLDPAGDRPVVSDHLPVEGTIYI